LRLTLSIDGNSRPNTATSMSTLVFFFSFVAAIATAAELFVYEAGTASPKKQLLQDNFVVCPSTFSPNGISIECVTLKAAYAKFSVNGTMLRTERMSPYTIAGDVAAVATKWNPPAGIVAITCNDVTVTGSFNCAAMRKTPIATSPKLYVREAGEINPKSLMLNPGFKICPEAISPKTGGISVECVDPTASKAEFSVNGKVVRMETWPPYCINGDTDSKLRAWTPPSGNVTILCTTNLGSTSITGIFTCSGAVDKTQVMRK